LSGETAPADVLVVGGGIVGLASARALQIRLPGARVTVLEKEAALAAHQTGRNSGVIHSGIYYKPGSHKARNCREGKRLLEEFCAEEGIPFERCGKVIVATREDELPRLQALEERGRANGVRCRRVGPERLRELEPEAAGIAALHVPETGIVDYVEVCERLALRVERAGGRVLTGARVLRLEQAPPGVRARTTAGEFAARFAVNCAGLHNDRLARGSGARPAGRIVPFRGEYYELTPDAARLCRNLIYPVPDPAFPFLGVHFTRMIGGGVECGPNAVLALAREGYDWRTVSLRDCAEVLGYPGFWRLAWRHGRTGLGEVWRSWSKAAFTRALQRLIPAVRAEHLRRAPAGVRAQMLQPDGGLVDDFLFAEQERVLHVLNAPSPAATSSLAIGDAVAEKAAARLAP
jgi:L-2-hydroxyglutarate oxidase